MCGDTLLWYFFLIFDLIFHCFYLLDRRAGGTETLWHRETASHHPSQLDDGNTDGQTLQQYLGDKATDAGSVLLQ